MKQYKTVNNLIGWITFIIAATVYCMTIEPTASFWYWKYGNRNRSGNPRKKDS